MPKNTSNEKKNSPSNQDLELAFQGIKKFGKAPMRLGDATKMNARDLNGFIAIDLALARWTSQGKNR